MSGRTAYIIMLTLMLLPCMVSASSGITYPVVTTDITVADGIKTYIYHLTNPAGSGYFITSFDLYMPEAGAKSVIEFIYPSSAWGGEVNFNGDTSYWVTDGGEIREGETRDFVLTTPADVPTDYNYVVRQSDTNWGWGTTHAVYGSHSSLPVPVPEPSSLLALLLAVSGLGARWVRRMR